MTRQPPLSLEEQEFVDRKVKRMGSTKLASYLFWFFFGVYGIHRFYNGAIKTGVALLSMHLIGVIILISAAVSIMASGINLSTFGEYVECIEDNPHDYQDVCEEEYRKEFEGQFRQNWGEDGPDIPVVSLTIGGVLFGGTILWWLVDAFLIPGLVRRKNRQIRQKCIQEVLRHRRQQEQQQEQFAQQPRYYDEQS